MKDHSLPPLHVSQVHQPHTTINRIYAFLHFFAILLLFYYRFSSRFVVPVFPWLLITASEMLLSFFWVLSQAYRWRQLSRKVFPDRLPEDEKLPAIDVFVCTADPKKEPTLEVMNTVISAMALDYPTDKLSVYISDDAGAPITLLATREAYKFAKIWVPFCRSRGIKTRCPEAYFSESDGNEDDDKFLAIRGEIKSRYEAFKQFLDQVKESGDECYSSPLDRPPFIEVIRSNETDEVEKYTIPTLIYVSREKRQSHPNHFKSGALNVLLRVSGIMSNAPYILVLDCDMYCNNTTSARQAMCFHLDPHISKSLAFVQFPQNFHNMSKNDIYNGQFSSVFKIFWPGMDGLEGPGLCGSGFYLKRESLYGSSPHEDVNLFPNKQCFGPSNMFSASLHGNHESDVANTEEEGRILASCTYEKDTQWGEKIGFMYHCVAEDYFTGFLLHCKGWSSVFLYPSRPAFLGRVTTNLNDCLIQTTRFYSGVLQAGLSRFCPLIYGPSRMSILQSMCYAYFALKPLISLSFLFYAFVPQFCLAKGIPLYPRVSNPWFLVFTTIYISSHLQYLRETFWSGASLIQGWNEHRMSIIMAVTSYFLACVDITKTWIGLKEIEFVPTNKVVNEEEVERYNMDVFDFRASTIFLFLLTTIVNLNIAALVVGLRRVIIDATYDAMFGQILISFIVLILGYPIIEGMIIRKDAGRIPTSVTLLSGALVTIVMSLEFCYSI